MSTNSLIIPYSYKDKKIILKFEINEFQYRDSKNYNFI